jgi:DNA-binding MltR family transcriptional regulator
MCWLDDVLERLLRTVMIDDKSVNELMKDGRALQSFSTKLRLAYALGLIPEVVREDVAIHEVRRKNIFEAVILE